MHRVVVAVASTASGVVLLFSYRASTHTAEAGAVTAAPPPPSPVSLGDAAPASGPSSVPSPSLQAPVATTPPAGRSTAAPVSRAPVTTAAPVPGLPPSTPAVAATRQVTGGVTETRYGPVQVQLTVTGSRITGARTLQQPSGDGHTNEINAYAIPRLDSEAVTAQSAHIDAVSGATYTSEGYIGSLQSALDAAHVG